jgi:hypothetical protein
MGSNHNNTRLRIREYAPAICHVYGVHCELCDPSYIWQRCSMSIQGCDERLSKVIVCRDLTLTTRFCVSVLIPFSSSSSPTFTVSKPSPPSLFIFSLFSALSPCIFPFFSSNLFAAMHKERRWVVRVFVFPSSLHEPHTLKRTSLGLPTAGPYRK